MEISKLPISPSLISGLAKRGITSLFPIQVQAPLLSGFVGLAKRFVILHSDKLLALSVFYASISPISAIGFLCDQSIIPTIDKNLIHEESIEA